MASTHPEANICGLSTPESVKTALDGGAAFIGFVFFDKSPRHVSAETAARLAAPARNRAKTVAVTVNPSDALIDEIAKTLKPDFIQLHGAESPARVAEVRTRTGAGVIKAVSVAERSDLDLARSFDGAADHLLLDAKAGPDAALPGGNGEAFDWSLLTSITFSRPWFLAGGLNPWNVEAALRQTGAPFTDVSSGVERGPGVKDPALILAFLEAVRRAGA